MGTARVLSGLSFTGVVVAAAASSSLLAAARRGVRLLLLCTTPVVVVIVVVTLKNFLAELLLSLVDVRVQLVAVLPDRELLVVVNWNVNLARADRLVIRVVELGNVGVAEGLVSRQSLGRVKLKQVTQKIQRVVGSRWEHVAQAAGLARRQRLEHGLGEGRVDGLNVLGGGTACHLHDAVELVEGRGAGENGLAEEKLS